MSEKMTAGLFIESAIAPRARKRVIEAAFRIWSPWFSRPEFVMRLDRASRVRAQLPWSGSSDELSRKSKSGEIVFAYSEPLPGFPGARNSVAVQQENDRTLMTVAVGLEEVAATTIDEIERRIVDTYDLGAEYGRAAVSAGSELALGTQAHNVEEFVSQASQTAVNAWWIAASAAVAETVHAQFGASLGYDGCIVLRRVDAIRTRDIWRLPP